MPHTQTLAPLIDLTRDFDAALVPLRRHLHAHPELGFEEHETAAFIEANLEALGLHPRRVAGTGVIADVVGALPGPTVAYRADIDALPIQDAKRDVPYASTRPGVAHLCGHDAHTAVGLGVARRLVEARGRLRGTVRVFFQPNEEGTPSGAPRMIEAGVLDGVTAVYGIHVDPTLDAGRYGLIEGPVTASCDRFDAVVRGPSTVHSARPHLGVDTVWLATAFAQHLYTLAGRVTDARLPAVLTACRFEAGEAYNVIPQTVRFGGTLRCLDASTRAEMHAAMDAAAAGFAAMHGADVHVDFHDGAPPVINDAALFEYAVGAITEARGADALHVFTLPSMGAEDFAYYTERVPGLFVRVGTRSSARTAHPVHDALFDLDETALGPAARLMADLVMGRG